MSGSRGGSANTSKHNLFKKSPSVQQLREEIRKQFKEKLKIGRANEQCKRRDLFKSVVIDVQKHFSEIDEHLLEDDGTETLNTEEILQILVEVEQELVQKASEQQVEQYALDLENETNALLEQFVICSICNKYTEFEGNASTVICNECAKLHFNNENL